MFGRLGGGGGEGGGGGQGGGVRVGGQGGGGGGGRGGGDLEGHGDLVSRLIRGLPSPHNPPSRANGKLAWQAGSKICQLKHRLEKQSRR